jgi:hypothetical protein
VHNSARFPYISPAGTLWADDGAGHSWKADEIDNGGYFEVVGATTLFDMLDALQSRCDDQQPPCSDDQKWSPELVPIVITIDNAPAGAKQACGGASGDGICGGLGEEARPMGWAMRIANDFLAPPIGLVSSRAGRGAYASRALEVKLYRESEFAWPALRFILRDADDIDRDVAPAMSWYLSQRSLRDMEKDLCQGPSPTAATSGQPACHYPRDLDNNFCRLGEALGQGNLVDSIRVGDGCKALNASLKRKASVKP